MADMMERNALSIAQANASQAEMLVSQAIRASPRVQPIEPVYIAQGSVTFIQLYIFPLLISAFIS